MKRLASVGVLACGVGCGGVSESSPEGWIRSTGTADFDSGGLVAVDGSGAILAKTCAGHASPLPAGPNSWVCELVRYTPEGFELERQNYGVAFTGIDVTADGGLLLAGGMLDHRDVVLRTDEDGVVLWERRTTVPSPDNWSGIASACAGTDDASYVGAGFEGTFELEGAPVLHADTRAACVVRLDLAGSHQWTTVFDNMLDPHVLALGSGRVVMWTLAAGPPTRSLIVELTPGGEVVWEETLPGTVTAAAADAGTLLLAIEHPVTDESRIDRVYSKEGLPVIWSYSVPDSGYAKIEAMAVDAGHDVRAAGYRRNGSKQHEPMIFALDANGVPVWEVKSEHATYAVAKGIAIDDSGATIVTGEFEEELAMPFGSVTSAGDQEVFIARFSK